jgi:hypothetical protein
MPNITRVGGSHIGKNEMSSIIFSEGEAEKCRNCEHNIVAANTALSSKVRCAKFCTSDEIVDIRVSMIFHEVSISVYTAEL